MGKVSTDLSCITTVGLDLAKYVFFVRAVNGLCAVGRMRRREAETRA